MTIQTYPGQRAIAAFVLDPAAAFVQCRHPAWKPEHEATVGQRMIADARAANHKPTKFRPRDNRKARIARVRSLLAEGMGTGQIAALLRVSGKTINLDIQVIAADDPDILARVAARRPSISNRPTRAGAKAREMAAAGATVDDLHAGTGLSRRQCQKIVRAVREDAA